MSFKAFSLTCLALLGILMLVACGDNTAPSTAASSTTSSSTTNNPTAAATSGTTAAANGLDSQKVEAGHKVFATQCTICHLNDGKSAGGVGPNLSISRVATNANRVRTTVRRGEDAMPPFSTSQVSDADLDNIILYLQSIHRG